MLLRVFRITDRVSIVLTKLIGAIGQIAVAGITSAGRRIVARSYRTTTISTDSTRIESQIQSLSGVIVVLLASVATLVIWATSPQAQSNPVVRSVFSIGATEDPSQNQGLLPISNGGVNSTFQAGTGTLLFTMRAGNQTSIFALTNGQSQPVRLTYGSEDDQGAVWSPDGQKIAFASRRDGNWELYTINISTGEIKRLTFGLSYDGSPSWSPDSQWLAYESYESGNLDIFIVKADATEGPFPVTHNPGADHSPAWTRDTSGRTIAYISQRGPAQDIYLISLDDPDEQKATNLTNTPTLRELTPKWDLSGNYLAYTVVENGLPLVYADNVVQVDSGPQLAGQGYSPTWSPDGKTITFFDRQAKSNLLVTVPSVGALAPGQAFALSASVESLDWSAAYLPQPAQGELAFAATTPITQAYTETLSIASGQGGPTALITLPGVTSRTEPVLSDQVDGSFVALKDYINRRAGWDFLSRLDQVWWALNRPPEPGQSVENWHKAGRAFDIVQSYNQGDIAQIELVPEQIGPEMYWRLYIRCAIQDGTLGEPLRYLPWDYAAAVSGDVQAYEAGGKLKAAIPAGYYVDFTEAAAIFGWERTPSDLSWRSNWPGVLYWQYQRTDSLDWWTAMLQLYPESTLRQIFSTPLPTTPRAVGTQPSVVATATIITTPAQGQTPTATSAGSGGNEER